MNNPWEGLRAFARHFLLENPYIYDIQSLTRKWIDKLPADTQNRIPKAMREDLEAVINEMERTHCAVPPLKTLWTIANESSNYRAFDRDIALCPVGHCLKKREHPHWPACDMHMCPLCAAHAEPGWRKRYRREEFAPHELVHLMVREEPEIYQVFAQQMRTPNPHVAGPRCPGVLSTCMAASTTTLYRKSADCWGSLMVTPVQQQQPNKMAHFCAPCRELNTCETWKVFSSNDSNRLAHLLTVDHPARYKAGVCNDQTCAVLCECIARDCRVAFYVSPEYATRERRLWLCRKCEKTRVACFACKRIGQHPDDMFFAPAWIKFPPFNISAQRYCVRCLNTKDDRLMMRVYLWYWRLTRRREERWLEELQVHDPHEWLRHMLPPEQCALVDAIPNGWALLQENECGWNTDFFLMLRLAQLPKDLWIKMWRLITQ